MWNSLTAAIKHFHKAHSYSAYEAQGRASVFVWGGNYCWELSGPSTLSLSYPVANIAHLGWNSLYKLKTTNTNSLLTSAALQCLTMASACGAKHFVSIEHVEFLFV